jgi:cytochrome c biogenesis protein CcmG, thiol:disulfide interchange protein DsbE
MQDQNKVLQRPISKTKVLALLCFGSGLLILGITGLLFLPKLDTPASTPRYSVVPVKVNFNAPEITLADLKGQPISLAAYRGKVVLVNNWATWCPPCKEEMPDLEAFYEAHQSQDFELIGIEAGDPTNEVSTFVKQYGLSFPIWLDPEGKALDAFQNQALPSSYVIDKNGTVRLAWSGAISREMLEKYVVPLLEE